MLLSLVLACNLLPQADPPCVDLPNVPRASVMLSQGLGQGTWDVTYSETGRSETCVITVGQTHGIVTQGEMVMLPTTETSSTCTSVSVGGMNDDGTVAVIDVAGTPASFDLELGRDGKNLGRLHATPDYTPDRCGFVQPLVPMTITP